MYAATACSSASNGSRTGTARRPTGRGAVAVVNALKGKGFLIGNAGAFGNVVKIRPPLVFSADDAAAFLAAFESTLDDLGYR